MIKRIQAVQRLFSLTGFSLLAACSVVPPVVAPPPQASPPPPRPAPPSPPPTPVAIAPEKAWDVAPLASGDWSYRRDQQGPTATFGPPNTEGSLEIRCRPQTHQLVISRLGSVGQSATMTIRTSAGNLSWSATPSRDGLEMMIVTRPATDPGFDWIAYSRGRISVEVPGLARLILPVWAEVSRVIEDCRS